MRKLWGFAVGLMLLMLAAPTLAQTPVELPDGYVIDFPDGAEVDVTETDSGVITAVGADLTADIYLPSVVEEYVELGAVVNEEALLAELVTALFGFEEPQIDELEIDNSLYAGWLWEISADDLKGISYLIPLEDGSYALIDVYAESAVYDESLAQMDALAVSLRLADEETTTSSAGASNEPVECFVSTADEGTVQLRVGPGENRSVITFLPAGGDFTVTGSFNDNDGGVWFQLDKAEVAPDSPAAELWVFSEDVDATADCDDVVAVNAPPIIPASNRPPTTTTTTTGGGSGSTGNTGNTGTTGGSIVNGLWSLYYSPTGNASCIGGQNVSINTQEFLGTTVEANVLSVQNGVIVSSAAQNDGGVSQAEFTVTGPGQYTISYNYGGGVNSQVYLNVVSSRSMVGQEIFNFSIDGTACSGTISITASPS